jgi:hypothetical protein
MGRINIFFNQPQKPKTTKKKPSTQTKNPVGTKTTMARISCVMRMLVFLCAMSLRIMGVDGSLDSAVTPTAASSEEEDIHILAPGKVEEADGWIDGVTGGSVDMHELAFSIQQQQNPSNPSSSKNDDDDDDTDNNNNNSEDKPILVDVAIFPLPPTCTSTPVCDYVALGVGVIQFEPHTGVRTIEWCHNGRLALDTSTTSSSYQGQHVVLEIPTAAAGDKQQITNTIMLSQSIFVLKQSGHYMVLIANCNSESGRSIAFSGRPSVAYKSGQGGGGGGATSDQTKKTDGGSSSFGSFVFAVAFLYACFRFYRYWLSLVNGNPGGEVGRGGYNSLAFEMGTL